MDNRAINFILEIAMRLIGGLLQVFTLPADAVDSMVTSFDFLVSILNEVAFFLPLDTFVTVFGIKLLVDNYYLLSVLILKVVGWITP